MVSHVLTRSSSSDERSGELFGGIGVRRMVETGGEDGIESWW